MNREKIESQKLIGKCSFCGGTFSKAVMTKHLKGCKQRKMVPMKVYYGRKSKKRDKRMFHLIVEGTYLPEYWMHLNVPAEVKLQELDEFLRETWLECCGHLSAFTINNIHYKKDIFTMDTIMARALGRMAPRSMNIRVGCVLRSGLKFHYAYDFGTTTHLTLRVLSEREEYIRDRSIQILAMNEPPPIICEMCGKPATQVCSQCINEDKGWLCDECIQGHECGEDMFLPVVNSPRVGRCGYTG